MKSVGIIASAVFLILLAFGWQDASATSDALRSIETAEMSRTMDAGLVAQLDDADSQVAARAALAIGRTHQRDGAAALRTHLTSRDPALRALCAYGLGLLAEVDALSSLRAVARHDVSSGTRYAALDAIGRIVTARPELASHEVAVDILIVARGDADPIVRAHASAQLEVFRASSFASEIARALERLQDRDPDQDVRWHAAWALARGYAKLLDLSFLRASLHDRNVTVRLEAAHALGRNADARAIALATQTLADPSWHVQLEARESLRRLHKQTPTEHLTAIPPGVHLPVIAPAADTSPAPSPAPIPTGAAKLTPPDPQTFDLGRFVAPSTARAFDGLPPERDGAVIRTTKGDITIAFYRAWAPSTVANFLSLAARHYYDGNRWFRIVPDFVVQTGDPNDNGDGDAGYTIPAEENPIEQRAGVISMGLNYDKNGAERDSAGTQFYLTLSPQLHLDRDFTVFGEVTGGFDVLAHLVERDRIITITPLPAANAGRS